MDGAAHYAEQLAWQQEAERVLRESLTRPLKADEVKLLAWCGNLEVKQEATNEI